MFLSRQGPIFVHLWNNWTSKGNALPPTMFAGGNTVGEHLDNLKANPLAELDPSRRWAHVHTGPLSGARLLAAGAPSVILTRFDAENTPARD